MNAFEMKALRLKQLVQVSTDLELSELLGLSNKAYGARKRRDAFPENNLYSLMVKRPDLAIDAAYVLTGKGQAQGGTTA